MLLELRPPVVLLPVVPVPVLPAPELPVPVVPEVPLPDVPDVPDPEVPELPADWAMAAKGSATARAAAATNFENGIVFIHKYSVTARDLAVQETGGDAGGETPQTLHRTDGFYGLRSGG
jgi:hypothetical protein